MDKTIKIFKGFAKDHADAMLLVHCDPMDPAGVFDLRALIHDLELDNRVLFTGATFYDGFPYSKMPEVYNLMDVFLLSTSGEGFGVPIIEAMSTSIPVVATSYTTTHELVEQNNAGFGIRLSGCDIQDFFDLSPKEYDWRLVNGTVTGSWNVERGFCDVMHGAELLTKLYDNPDLKIQMGNNGREAVLREYTWEAVAKKFDTVLSGLLRW
jgi:glycosyltransferase involved in cell wall biosynthesis